MVETSMTFSTCVVYNIWCLGTFNFLENKLENHKVYVDRKGTQMFLSLLRGAEVVSKFQAMNRRVLTEPKTMLGRPLSLQLCLYRQCISRTTLYDAERDK